MHGYMASWRDPHWSRYHFSLLPLPTYPFSLLLSPRENDEFVQNKKRTSRSTEMNQSVSNERVETVLFFRLHRRLDNNKTLWHWHWLDCWSCFECKPRQSGSVTEWEREWAEVRKKMEIDWIVWYLSSSFLQHIWLWLSAWLQTVNGLFGNVFPLGRFFHWIFVSVPSSLRHIYCRHTCTLYTLSVYVCVCVCTNSREREEKK